MKSTLALHVLVAIFFFIGANGSLWKTNLGIMESMNEIKFEAKNISRKIADYVGNCAENFAIRYDRYREESIGALRSMINQRISSIADSVEASNNSKSDVAACISLGKAIGEQTIADVRDSECDELDLLSLNNFVYASSEKKRLDGRIRRKLDNTFLKCCAANCSEFESCAIPSLLSTTNALENFRAAYEDVVKDCRKLLETPDKFACFKRHTTDVITNRIPKIYTETMNCVNRPKKYILLLPK